MSKVTFPYSEARLAVHLGVSRTRVRLLRVSHLEENRDWQKNGAEILLSYEGVTRICKLEGAPHQNLNFEACLAQKNGAEPSTPTKKMMVVAPMPINPRLVLAEDENGECSTVDVGRNGTFVYGDEIEVAQHESQADVWQLLSPVPRDRRRPHR